VPHRRGRRISRVASVSVQPDGVININPASPYGRTCSGHDRARPLPREAPADLRPGGEPVGSEAHQGALFAGRHARWSSG
jgi:hypothetical protein